MPWVRSSRRVGALKPSDYDHEIDLVNHDETGRTRSPQTEPAHASPAPPLGTVESLEPSPAEPGPGRSGNHDQGVQVDMGHQADVSRPSIEVQAPTPAIRPQDARRPPPKKSRPTRETAIDILYENERGGFLCGTALFSSRALGGLDPPPWTNAYHKASPTSTHTAQVPDPSWEWLWPDWRINHQEGMDDDGWEYSFAFSKKFSWHKAKWWNSFVRRRAWTRKRIKKKTQDLSSDPHMLNTNYFTIRPASHHDDSIGSRVASKSSMSQLSSSEAEQQPDIEDVESLLRILRHARIDREKWEAVENYLEHAADLSELGDEMHEIMSLFVFQASRRYLLRHLMRKHALAVKELAGEGGQDETALLHRKKALDAAVHHAQEEVNRLAYWSDVKRMAEDDEPRDSLDSEQGWYDAKPGSDQSGTKAAGNGKSRA